MPKGNLAPAHAAADRRPRLERQRPGRAAAHPDDESGAHHGGTKTQADLYEVPHKHKH